MGDSEKSVIIDGYKWRRISRDCVEFEPSEYRYESRYLRTSDGLQQLRPGGVRLTVTNASDIAMISRVFAAFDPMGDTAPSLEASKADQEKTRLDLLPFDALEEVGRVLTLGAVKYSAHNWRKGMAWHRLFGAALRHLWAWYRREEADPESGRSHLAHAACCVLFLLSYTLTKSGEDDRP